MRAIIILCAGVLMATVSTASPDKSVRQYIYGHSLINHYSTQQAPEFTSVPYWLAEFAKASGYPYFADGQFGFLPQHANLPPQPQWGFPNVTGVWDLDSGETYREAEFSSVMITAANFIQYQPASRPYDGDNPTATSPLKATQKIIDWSVQQKPDTHFHIYENWPDMAPFIQRFPPTQSEHESYWQYTQGEFHDWWADYVQALKADFPNNNLTLIPVGPVLGELLTQTDLAQVPLTDWYEDDAPHGTPNLYFLAALITYQYLYDEPAQKPKNFQAVLHPQLIDQFAQWTRCIENYR